MNEQINKMLEIRNMSKTTVDIYSRNLDRLAYGVLDEEFCDLAFLEHFDFVKDFLKTLNLSTRKVTIVTILVALRTDEDKYRDLILKYLDYFYEVSQKYFKKSYNRKIERRVDFDDILIIYNSIKDQVYDWYLDEKMFLDKQERKLLQKYLVLSLYILIEPRRNYIYTDMIVIHEDKLKRIDKNKNYLIKGRNGDLFFIFDNGMKHPIVGNLKTVLDLWIAHNPHSPYLIENNRGYRMSANSLTRYIMKLFYPLGRYNIGYAVLKDIWNEERKLFSDN